jgi:putative metallohydrolase (TIGR04338 family)
MDHQHETPTIQIAGSMLTLPAELKFGDIPSMQRYIDLILPGEGIKVRSRRGTKSAHYQMGEIAIPMLSDEKGYRWACRQLVLIHEAAHHLAGGDQHGSQFTARYVELLDKHMGPEVALIMRISLHENGAH